MALVCPGQSQVHVLFCLGHSLCLRIDPCAWTLSAVQFSLHNLATVIEVILTNVKSN